MRHGKLVASDSNLPSTPATTTTQQNFPEYNVVMSENIQVVEEGTACEAFEAVAVGQVKVVAIKEEDVFTKEQLENGLVQLVFFK